MLFVWMLYFVSWTRDRLNFFNGFGLDVRQPSSYALNACGAVTGSVHFLCSLMSAIN